MRTYLTTAAVAALAWLPPAIPAAAQEATVAEALEYLQRGERVNGVSAHEPAAHILRQASGPRTSAELDAFADRLAEIAADATLPEHVRMRARFALAGAARPDESYYVGGTPYPRAFDLLVQVRESGDNHALSDIMGLDPVRGLAYVREVFERSERPPLCHRGGGYPPADQPAECDSYSFWRDARPTPWCEAGGYLFGGIVAEAWERTPGGKRPGGAGYPAPYPEGLPEHVEDWHRRCR